MREETWPLRIFKKSNGLLYLASEPDIPVFVMKSDFEPLKVRGNNGYVLVQREVKSAVKRHILTGKLDANAYETDIAYFSCSLGRFECEVKIYAIKEPVRTNLCEPLPYLR